MVTHKRTISVKRASEFSMSSIDCDSSRIVYLHFWRFFQVLTLWTKHHYSRCASVKENVHFSTTLFYFDKKWEGGVVERIPYFCPLRTVQLNSCSDMLNSISKILDQLLTAHWSCQTLPSGDLPAHIFPVIHFLVDVSDSFGSYLTVLH